MAPTGGIDNMAHIVVQVEVLRIGLLPDATFRTLLFVSSRRAGPVILSECKVQNFEFANEKVRLHRFGANGPLL